MPSPLLHLGAIVTCSHGGQAVPVTTNARVSVLGQPIVTQTDSYGVAGCGFAPPSGNGPCTTANFTFAASRVFASGQAVILQSSLSVCTPTGTPLVPMQTQLRVLGS